MCPSGGYNPARSLSRLACVCTGRPAGLTSRSTSSFRAQGRLFVRHEGESLDGTGPFLMQPRRPKHHSMIEEFVPREQRPKVHPAGRRCGSCSALLSIYNELSECWACHPTGRKIHKYGGQEPTPDVIDFVELMEDAA